MGVVVKHVQADKKTGRLVFRRAFPATLRQSIPGQPREFIRSLQSTELDAFALALRDKALAEFDRLVATARKVVVGLFDRLDEPQVAYLAEAFYQLTLEEDEVKRWSVEERKVFENVSGDVMRLGGVSSFEGREAVRFAEKTAETTEAMLACYRYIAGTGDMEALLSMWGDEAEDFAASHGFRVDPSAPDFISLCRALNASAIRAGEAKMDRLEGKAITTPAVPIRPAEPGTGPTETANTPTSFEGIAAEILSNPALGISATTAEAWRTALRFLREAFGALAPRQLSRRHAAELRDLLTERPARPAKDARQMALRDLVEAHKERPDVPRLTGVTVRQHLRSLSTIWTRAQEEGFIAEPLTNPFKGVRVNIEASPDNPQELSRDELLAMFGTPVFTEGERPAGGRGEAAFWLPLLAFFTGARPEEVAQLMVSDTFRDDQGRFCLKISGEGEAHPAKGKRTLKTRKTRTGVRQFPLPNGLIGLGFGEYVDWLKGREERALFPLLTTRGNRGLHAGFSRWWSGYLRRNKASPQGDGRKPWREFRQCFSSAAIRGELSLEERNYLMGHAIDPGTASGHYGNRNPMGVAMLRVAFDESVVEHVTPWRQPCSVNDTK